MDRENSLTLLWPEWGSNPIPSDPQSEPLIDCGEHDLWALHIIVKNNLNSTDSVRAKLPASSNSKLQEEETNNDTYTKFSYTHRVKSVTQGTTSYRLF
jgi:hypothetical protein